jgi:uncharacterized membrane protein
MGGVVSGPAGRFSRALETVLTAGIAASAALLLAGLAFDAERTLRAGIVLLILTPVARVVAVAVGFVHARDWAFAVLSLTVLGVLASSAWVGLGGAR